MKSEKFFWVLKIAFWYLCLVVVLCPLVGTIFAFFDWKWEILAVVTTLSIAGIVTYLIRNTDLFLVQNWKEFVILSFLVVSVSIVYSMYSPVLSVQQDQAAYIMRAFNLLNYGYPYKPMSTFTALNDAGIIGQSGDITGYGGIENANQILNGKMYVDFYSGGAYFFALCGFIVKRFAFYGQSILTIINAVLLYFIIKKVLKSKDKLVALLYTLTFMAAPMIVWFGRSSSTEPTALFFWLLIFNVLLNEKIEEWCLVLIFTVALIGRIDYLIVVLMGVFVITYRNKIYGIIYACCASVFGFICSKVYWIYYNRISINDFKLVKYQIPLILIVLVISIIISKYAKEWIEKIYYAKWVKYVLLAFGTLVLLMMFRDTFTPESLYGRFTEFGLNIRSYEEYIMDNLFTVFPAFIILGGLMGCYKVINNKNINMLSGVFFLGLMIVYSYFVYKSGNAPQMYFLLRRYYNIFIPSVLVCFVIFIETLDRKKNLIIAFICFTFSCNLSCNSRQIVEYNDLDNRVFDFVKAYPENSVATVFYDNEIKYDFSPIVSYTSYDIVPLQSEQELKNVCSNTEYYDKSKSLYVSENKIGNLEYSKQNLSYYRMGENAEELPKEHYYIEVEVYVYNMADVIDYYGNGTK